ncbi:unnamed protein product, partial [Iphiclides podalirius]
MSRLPSREGARQKRDVEDRGYSWKRLLSLSYAKCNHVESGIKTTENDAEGLGDDSHRLFPALDELATTRPTGRPCLQLLVTVNLAASSALWHNPSLFQLFRQRSEYAFRYGLKCTAFTLRKCLSQAKIGQAFENQRWPPERGKINSPYCDGVFAGNYFGFNLSLERQHPLDVDPSIKPCIVQDYNGFACN